MSVDRKIFAASVTTFERRRKSLHGDESGRSPSLSTQQSTVNYKRQTRVHSYTSAHLCQCWILLMYFNKYTRDVTDTSPAIGKRESVRITKTPRLHQRCFRLRNCELKSRFFFFAARAKRD